ncbi:MAG: hypothetical protein H6730_07145 [Deltaproteobacteria bacterium]|nr:hypothetical protein [Deltaproteobacteria bacterium]
MLLRRRLTHTTLALGASALALAGCAKDLELKDPVDLTTVVRAQFDPTNPIPVLQLVPSPTLLAQDPTNGFKFAVDPTTGKTSVAPEDCELPTSAQCLAFVDSWPTTAPITLYFSGALDETSVKDGVKLWELNQTTGALTELDYVFRTGARDPINAACQTAFGYTADQEPPGIQLQLAATTALKPNTQYVVTVESSAAGGLRAEDGSVVEATALVALLNVPDGTPDPVTSDGVIQSALLRSNVQGLVAKALFPTKSTEELTAEEKAQLAAAVQARGASLYGLYQFFDKVIDLAVANGVVTDRKDLILTNTWITGRDPTTVAFDPANSVVPFPNSQLLTAGDLTDPTMLQVNLPVDPSASPTAQALIGGLNTLNGFSTTAPQVVSTTRNIDPDSLAGNVLMYRVVNGVLDNTPHNVIVTTSSASEGGLASITIQPFPPLQDNAHYVTVIKRGVKDTDGVELEPQSTFNLLKTPAPLIDAGGTVLAPVVPALQCSFLSTTGSLGNDTQVAGLASTIEADPADPDAPGLGHQKWLVPIGLLTAEPVAIPPEDILFAWSYNTQDIRGLMSTVRDTLIPAWDAAAPGPRVIGPVAELTGTASIAGALNVVGNLCLPLCLQGQMEPQIPPAQCGTAQAPNPAMTANPVCQLAINLVAGNLAKASLYLMRTYRATTGNPYVAGTFTPATLQSPTVENIQVWVLQGNGTPPATGLPVAIVQHGLGSRKEAGWLAADRLATANAQGGWASVLIDLPFHGSRASDLTALTQTPLGFTEVPCTDANGRPNVDPGAVVCDPTTGMCNGGCDGVQDSSGTGFLSTNVFGSRDNFRQSLIDHLVLARTLELESQAGGAFEGILDGSQIGYIGQSLGGITGGNFMAFAPDNITGGVLNVAGGGLTTILVNTVPQISAGLFASLNAAGVCEYNIPNNPVGGCKDTPAFRQFLLTAQWALDPGDPLATSIGVHAGIGAQNVMIQMAQPDPVVSNLASIALAGSYGYLTPNSPLASHFEVFDMTALPQASVGSGCHGFLLSPLASNGEACGACLTEALCNSIGAQIQAAGFLEAGDGSVPPRPDAVAGIFDCTNPCP